MKSSGGTIFFPITQPFNAPNCICTDCPGCFFSSEKLVQLVSLTDLTTVRIQYYPSLQCVRDIVAFVFKFDTLFTHSLSAELVVNPETGLIPSDHSRMGYYPN